MPHDDRYAKGLTGHLCEGNIYALRTRRSEDGNQLYRYPATNGNSVGLRPFVKREVMPGDLSGTELQTCLRDAVTTYWHQAGTASLGRDSMWVVDGRRLHVYGVDSLRIADASIMPPHRHRQHYGPRAW